MASGFLFRALAPSDLASLALDGAPLSGLGGDALLAAARAAGLPRSIGDEQQLRLALGCLLQLSSVAGAVPADAWLEVREEARGLLLLALRRDGRVTASTAAALNVLNQGQVVEKYKTLGNRWTIPEASRDAPSAERDHVERARKELGGESAASTREWLAQLADALEAPADARPWYASKVVMVVLMLSALFILAHLVLLARVLQKVHVADNRVLLYPIGALSAAGAVGAFAIGVHKLSDVAPKGSGAERERLLTK